jgi:DNA polymerase IV
MALELPRIFLLPTHLQADERRRLEEKIPTLTHDVQEADVILGRISRPERALFELRRLKLATEPVISEEIEGGVGRGGKRERDGVSELPSKRPRLSKSETLGTEDETSGDVALDMSREPRDVVLVLKLAWLLDSLEQDVILPVDDYLLYRGRKLSTQSKNDLNLGSSLSKQESEAKGQSHTARQASAVLARAAEDQHQRVGSSPYSSPRATRRRTDSPNTPGGRKRAEPPTLYHETTSEHDVPLPPIPEFLHTTYSCQRPSLVNPPNAAFIKELKAVRTLRLLQGDQVGVRAYSTSIASLAAYPYLLQRPQGESILYWLFFSQ